MFDLNKEQLMAVEHTGGPLLVLAGAGSGKTRIITYKIANLLKLGLPANKILALTFTNKAAEEMQSRIQKMSNEWILACTFHSLCLRILRETYHLLGFSKDFVIYDSDDSLQLIDACAKELGLQDKKGQSQKLQSDISKAKNSLHPCANMPIYNLYQQKLKQYNAVDFDDLLLLVVKLFKENPDVLAKYQQKWSFVLIDEYQDTNLAQYTIVKQLADSHKNILAVGDPDQSIYSWRGANIQNILNFEADYPNAKVIALEQNYRSHNYILSAANELIKNNNSRRSKNLWSSLGEGEKLGLYICESERAEADFVVEHLKEKITSLRVSLNDCAIFYRTNFQSRIFEDALIKKNIPYILIGSVSFYQRKEIKDILALLRVVLNASDFLAVNRTINLPKRGIGKTTIAKIQEFCESKDAIQVIQAICAGELKCSLSTSQINGLRDYTTLILSLRKKLSDNSSVKDLVVHTIEDSGYLSYLKEEDSVSYEERKKNLDQLITKALEWEEENKNLTLSNFLEELSLRSETNTQNKEKDAIKLMTLHNSKGLEFSIVLMVGMEEELFPHANSINTESELEEERRLCYVGITRAKKYLCFTASKYRFLWGACRPTEPSRFLAEIPEKYLNPIHGKPKYYQPYTPSVVEKFETKKSTPKKVSHKIFGVGVVKKEYHTSSGLTYDIFFSKLQQLKSIVAKYVTEIS